MTYFATIYRGNPGQPAQIRAYLDTPRSRANAKGQGLETLESPGAWSIRPEDKAVMARIAERTAWIGADECPAPIGA